MKNPHELGQDQFDALLRLFSDDRDEAAEKYEQIRRGLARFFQFKGCADPHALADETINRVALKAEAFDPARNIKPLTYFYGFASNILLEYRRTSQREMSLDESEYMAGSGGDEEDSDEAKTLCLQKCLGELPPDDRDLILDYYARDEREKIEFRRKMCELFDCTPGSLHIRVFRLKALLRTCIDHCAKLNS